MPQSVLQKAARINPHGLGIVWLDNYNVTYHKSGEWHKLQTDRPYIAHFRYATVGKVCKENTHPFVCGEVKHELLMQNGTVKGYGNKNITDTEELAIELGQTSRDRWARVLSMYDARFVSINTRTKSFQIYNKDLWIRHEGVWYSKGNVLERHLVAVYGTLKVGYSNYAHHLGTSTYVGNGKTKDKYPLVVSGLPYVIERKGEGTNVSVDVFMVNDDVFNRLDGLEGHPRWYVRKQIPIVIDGKTVMCWLYFNPSADKFYNGKNWVGSYEERPRYIPRFTFKDVKPTKPLCINCFNDLQFDDFNLYHCQSCGEWFTEQEAQELNYLNK